MNVLFYTPFSPNLSLEAEVTIELTMRANRPTPFKRLATFGTTDPGDVESWSSSPGDLWPSDS